MRAYHVPVYKDEYQVYYLEKPLRARANDPTKRRVVFMAGTLIEVLATLPNDRKVIRIPSQYISYIVDTDKLAMAI